MSKKTIILILSVTLILSVGVFWVVQKRQGATNQNVPQEQIVTDVILETPRFVTEVDLDVSHWQMKETEFFTIKFPKEWYWLESDPTKQGYPANSGRSRVITNNLTFDIDKYADIGIFTGGSYHQVSKSGKVESIPLQDDEVVISFGGTATANSGTPEQSINSVFQSKQENPYPVDCQRLSSPNIVPIRAYCSFIDNTTATTPQKIQTYYIVNELNNISVSARTTETSTVPKDILDKIAESMTVKETW